MKRSAHSKAVLDAWFMDYCRHHIASSTQTVLLHDRSYLSHSESEPYKLRDSKSRATFGREEVWVWSSTWRKKTYRARLALSPRPRDYWEKLTVKRAIVVSSAVWDVTRDIPNDGCGEDYLTIRPVARKSYGSIAHEAKPNGLLTRGPWGRRV